MNEPCPHHYTHYGKTLFCVKPFGHVGAHQFTIPSLKIEAGKYYRTRLGNKRYVVSTIGLNEWPVISQSEESVGFVMHRADGTAGYSGAHNCDLIKEWKEETQEEKDAKEFYNHPMPAGYLACWHAACKYARSNITPK